MPDLATVFEIDGIPDPQELLRALEVVLAPRRGHRVVRYGTSCFAAVNVLKPFSFALQQPFLAGDDCLMIDGCLFDARPFDELISILFSAQPEQVRTLNGQFNAVVYRGDRNELIVITDMLGYRPLYCAAVGQRYAISSEIRGVRAGLNRNFGVAPIGLMELLAFGHNVAERTLLDGVTVLPPGSIITINDNGLHVARYEQFGYARSMQSESATPREWGRRIADCAKSMSKRYVSGTARKGIFLSGGLDSRIVAGAIGETSAQVHAFTFGDPGVRDVMFARETADQLGFPHTVLTYPSDYLSSAVRTVVSRSECAAPFYHSVSVVFHDVIEHDTEAILVGFCGDILSGGHLKRRMLKALSSKDISEEIFHRALCCSIADISAVLQPGFFKRHWREAMEAFQASVAVIDEENAADTADVWDMEHRQRRFTFSATKVDRHRFEVIAPLLDREFIELMTSLPIKARWKQLAYRYAILDGFPALRSVPWARTGRPIPAGRLHFWEDEVRRVGSKLYNRMLRKLHLGGDPSKDRYRDIAAHMRRDKTLIANHLLRHLSSGVLPEEIFNAEGVQDVYQRHMAGEDHSHLLGTLVTIAEYLSGWACGEHTAHTTSRTEQ